MSGGIRHVRLALASAPFVVLAFAPRPTCGSSCSRTSARGNTAFQGVQDADPLNGTDCREGSPSAAGTVTVPGDLPQVVAPRDNEVRIAELQMFSR